MNRSLNRGNRGGVLGLSGVFGQLLMPNVRGVKDEKGDEDVVGVRGNAKCATGTLTKKNKRNKREEYL